MDIQYEKIVEKGNFILVCGMTGSGKTTFLKKLKEYFKDNAMMVMQNPDNQIIMDSVYGELAVNLSGKGLKDDFIKRRIAETASFFSLSHMFDKRTDSLSGGEKQILNLASVIACDKDVLLLDEPASMLDPRFEKFHCKRNGCHSSCQCKSVNSVFKIGYCFFKHLPCRIL